MRYRTPCGGILTLVMVLLVIAFSIIMIQGPMEVAKITDTNEVTVNVTKEQGTSSGGGSSGGDITWDTKIETIVKSEYNDFSGLTAPKIHNLTSSGFGIGVLNNFPLDPTVLGLVGLKNQKLISEAEGITIEGLATCSPSTFPVSSSQRITDYTVALAICLNLSEFTLQGNFRSPEYRIYQILYSKCDSGCKDDSEIKTILRRSKAQILAKNYYYDESDVNDPLKEYITEIDYLPVDGSSFNRKYVEVRENEVVFLNGTTRTFYDAFSAQDEHAVVPESVPVSLSALTIYMSPEKRTYTQVERINPVLSSRRSLTSTTNTTTVSQTNEKVKKENKAFLYYSMTILSQVGGFCYLIKMIFGGFINLFIDNFKSAHFINVIKELRIGSSSNAPITQNNNSQHRIEEENKNNSYQRMRAEIEGGMNESRDQIAGLDENRFPIAGHRLQSQLRRSKSKISKSFIPFTLNDVISKTFKCKKNLDPHTQTTADKLMRAQEMLFNEMDVIRILNEIKDLKEKNHQLESKYESLASNQVVTPPLSQNIVNEPTPEPSKSPTPSIKKAKEEKDIENVWQEAPSEPVQPIPLSPNIPPEEQKLESEVSISKNLLSHSQSQKQKKKKMKREIAQIAVNSIYSIIDQEMMNLKKDIPEHKDH